MPESRVDPPAADSPDEPTAPPDLDDVVRVVAMRAAQDGVFPFALADDFPAFGRPYREASANAWAGLRSIAAERHRSLNWLCGDAPRNRWDETPTDT